MSSHNNAVVIECGVCHGHMAIVVGEAYAQVPPYIVCVVAEPDATPVHYIKIPKVCATLDGTVVYVKWDYDILWLDTETPPKGGVDSAFSVRASYESPKGGLL